MSSNDDIRAWLKAVPYSLLNAEWHRRIAERRKKPYTGRPAKLRPCPKCGREFGARDLRKHKPRCGRKNDD